MPFFFVEHFVGSACGMVKQLPTYFSYTHFVTFKGSSFSSGNGHGLAKSLADTQYDMELRSHTRALGVSASESLTEILSSFFSLSFRISVFEVCAGCTLLRVLYPFTHKTNLVREL